MTEKNTQAFDSISTGDPASDWLNEQLGMDVDFVEAQIRFRLDHVRMTEGKTAELGYVLIDRQDKPNAAVVFATPAEAAAAVDKDPLVSSLVEEDSLACFSPSVVTIADLKGREVILP